MTAARPSLVCLTPMRNEAWVIERFLRCAEAWADLIVIVDQASTDGSTEIARRHPKVHLVEYPRTSFDEPTRRKMLVDLARSLVPGPRILVGLDADEVFTCDAWTDPEMQAFLRSPPGTLARLHWINILPDAPRAWIPMDRPAFMFVDDGREFTGTPIHGPRLPDAIPTETVDLEGPKVIHLQYLDWDRLKSKQRWYQAQDRLENPSKRAIQIYRQYHYMDAIDSAERHELRDEWFHRHELAHNLDLLAVAPRIAYQTDYRLLDLFEAYGAERFRRLDLWDARWQDRAAALGRPAPLGLLHDPHTPAERAVLRWLARTQSRALDRRVRWVQRSLRLAGW